MFTLARTRLYKLRMYHPVRYHEQEFSTFEEAAGFGYRMLKSGLIDLFSVTNTLNNSCFLANKRRDDIYGD